jgi:hypothetical protein
MLDYWRFFYVSCGAMYHNTPSASSLGAVSLFSIPHNYHINAIFLPISSRLVVVTRNWPNHHLTREVTTF